MQVIVRKCRAALCNPHETERTAPCLKGEELVLENVNRPANIAMHQWSLQQEGKQPGSASCALC